MDLEELLSLGFISLCIIAILFSVIYYLHDEYHKKEREEQSKKELDEEARRRGFKNFDELFDSYGGKK